MPPDMQTGAILVGTPFHHRNDLTLASLRILRVVAESEKQWLMVGYRFFARGGLAALKVETLAAEVKISKSSFYHRFKNIERFVELLCDYHLAQARIIAEKERRCLAIDPDLIHILLEHKIDLLFNRQLRIQRDEKQFLACLQESDYIVGTAFIDLWQRELRLNLTKKVWASLFSLSLENFYLQICDENLNSLWLAGYFSSLRTTLLHVASSAEIVR